MAILYFGLFANKENPDSLGNRLSWQNTKKNVGEVVEKGTLIFGSVNTAKDAIKELEEQKKLKFKAEKVLFTDSKEGEGEDEVACGDYVQASYKIFDQDDQYLTAGDFNSTVGLEENLLIEANIIGMKRKGVRILKISKDFTGSDSKAIELLDRFKSDLKYEITLVNFNTSSTPLNFCN